jgi:adenosylcobinamide-phosphate synthase
VRVCGPRVAGVMGGYLADLVFGDPRRGHPVAGFGAVAAALERLTYRDTRTAGAVHTSLLIGVVSVFSAALQSAAGRRGPAWSAAGTAAATWTALGGTSLLRILIGATDFTIIAERDDSRHGLR